MKKEIARGLIKLGLLAAIVTVMAGQTTNAQTLDNGLRATIPFDFMVGTRKLPAGRYSFRRAPTSNDSVLQINSLEGKATTFRTTLPVTTVKAKDNGTVVFHRYGNQYFLFQVWSAGALIGRSLLPSRNERDLQRKQDDSTFMSTNRNAESEVVSVAADLP